MNDDSDSHPSEARLMAYLDGELSPEQRAGVSRHVVECRACEDALDELRTASEGFSAAVSRLETPESSVTAGDLRSRDDGGAGPDDAVAGGIDEPRDRSRGRKAAVRIAASVAVLLGGAAALPGSPVRSWLDRSVQEVRSMLGVDEASQRVERPEPPRPDADDRSGVAVGPAQGSIRIRLGRVPDGTTIRVRLIEGSQAGVWNAGGEYRTASGRIEVASPTSERILVELPRSVYDVRLEVNGSTVAVKEGEGLDVRVPGAVLQEGEFEFTVPAGTQ